MKPRAVFTIVVLLFSVISAVAEEKEVIWSEDFESDWYENWYVDIGTWEVGTPTSGPQGAFKGNNCAATVLNGNYVEPVDTRLIRYSSFVVPPAIENPQIQFWHWWYFSAGDWGEVQIKTVHRDWETISFRYDQFGSDAWYRASIDLSRYADSTVQIAFYFHSRQEGSFGNTGNGWYIDNVSLVTGPDVFNNPEGFESGLGDWSVEKGTWDIGVPTSGPKSAHQGQYCFGTKLDGNYHEPVDSRLISPPFVIPSVSDIPRIQFWHWWQFAPGDWGEFQIRTNNSEWKTISIRITNYSGDAWYKESIELLDYADSVVQIAFYFHSQQVGSFGNTSKGWYIDDISVVTGPYIFNNPEDFEMGLGDWYVDRGTWNIGVPTAGPSNAYSGSNCAGTIINGNYHEPVDSRLISRPYIIPAATENPSVLFWHWFNFAAGDWGEVQITTDQGNTWRTISTQTINTSSGSWSPYFIPLTSFADSVVQIAFYFHSQQVGSFGNTSTGWYIDDVKFQDISELTLYAGPDVSLSSCSSTTINAMVSGGTEPYVFEWIPALGLNDPTSLTPIAGPSDTTVYTIKVTDAKGCFRTDRVVINTHCEAENTEAGILSFSFGKPPQSGSTTIDLASHSVTLAVKYGTDLTHLIPTFTLSQGATATVEGVDQKSGFTANDFTNPVTYRITAEDGITYQDWIVNVSVAAVEKPEILSFNFTTPPQAGTTIIDPVDRRVDLKVEHGTDVTGLIASFILSEGALATIGGVIQESGLTVNDFTEPLTYTLTAVDGETVQDWTVTVDIAKLNDTDILTYSFGIPPQTGNAVVNPITHAIHIEVENGTDVSNLVATYTLSEGATITSGGKEQVSGVTGNDFSNPVTYAVTASDGETSQDWIVNVDVAAAVGIKENSLLKLYIYPNPFSDVAIIEVSNPDQSNLTICVFGALGNKVFEKDLINSEAIELKRGSLPPGVYMVVLKGDKVLENKVVVIK